MRRTMMLLGAVALVAPSLSAQQVRWNDRPTSTWSEEAPRVRLFIEGPRAVSYGSPMGIRFDVSDNAFVTVVRVDDDGRMTILFPYSRTQRAAVRAGTHYVRNPRIGANVAFIATDRMSGYVFAVASYAPLDFSAFENRDYNNLGGWSRFTVANRPIARRPDVFIDRFAGAVLWDANTPYDYDVDYYHPIGYPGAFNTFAMCNSLGFWRPVGWRTYQAQFSSWDRVAYPWYFSSMCGDIYSQLRCYSSLALYGYSACNARHVVFQVPSTPVPGTPTEGEFVPNEGVVRGGLFAPTPVPIPVSGNDPAPPVERIGGRFDQPQGSDLDDVLSIPARATRKMKQDDARREKAAAESPTPARSGFDRTASEKPEKNRVADADAATRPPAREPTKAKNSGDTNRDTRSKGGYGSTGRTSEPRSTSGPDRVSRPVDKSTGTGSASGGGSPSIQGTTTEKKKPPTD